MEPAIEGFMQWVLDVARQVAESPRGSFNHTSKVALEPNVLFVVTEIVWIFA
jgi:hypothetical protein